MKKALSLILAVLLLLGCFTFTAFAADEIQIRSGVLYSYTVNYRSITLPEIVIAIYANVFAGVGDLDNVAMPKVIYIGEYAFQGCDLLTSITVSDSLETIDCAFDGAPLSVVNFTCDTSDEGAQKVKEVFEKAGYTGLEYHNISHDYKDGVCTLCGASEPVTVTLASSADKIDAGAEVQITVTATGKQNCADIVLTYDESVFGYKSATVANVTVPATPDGTLHILTADTADPINVLTFKARADLTADTLAEFKISSAKFAESLSAMTADAKAADTMTGTRVEVISNKHTVTFKDGETETAKEYFGTEQKIAEGDIPDDPTKTGYTFTGWSDGTKTYTATDLKDKAVTGDVIYTAVYTLAMSVDVQTDYVNGKETSYTKVVVTGDLDGYTYDGNEMYRVADKTFACIVAGGADASKVAASANKAEYIAVADKNDVNGTEAVDIADARAVYNCLNNLVPVADYMPVYLRADVNGDGKVDADDVAAVISSIRKLGN